MKTLQITCRIWGLQLSFRISWLGRPSVFSFFVGCALIIFETLSKEWSGKQSWLAFWQRIFVSSFVSSLLRHLFHTVQQHGKGGGAEDGSAIQEGKVCSALAVPSVLSNENHKKDPVDGEQRTEKYQYLSLVTVSWCNLCALLFYRILAKQIPISLVVFLFSGPFRNTVNPFFLFSFPWTPLSPGRSLRTAEAVTGIECVEGLGPGSWASCSGIPIFSLEFLTAQLLLRSPPKVLPIRIWLYLWNYFKI